MSTMKQEILTEWLRRLRSGEYKQGISRLKTQRTRHLDTPGEIKYCCLGVLCEMAAEAGAVEVTSTLVGSITEWSFGGDAGGLPESVIEWAGIDGMSNLGRELDEHGHYIPNQESLAGLNDGGVAFNGIADVIEERVQGV